VTRSEVQNPMLKYQVHNISCKCFLNMCNINVITARNSDYIKIFNANIDRETVMWQNTNTRRKE
jgi:hypothetical protein